MIRRISVRGIVLHEGKLLCVRLKRYEGSLRAESETDYWCLPGGGLDEGESLVAGVEREMIEETGIQPVVGNLLYIQQFTSQNKEYLDFFFHITNNKDYLNIDLSKTSHGMLEIAEIDFITPAEKNVLPKFLKTEPLEEFAASNNSTRIFSLF